MIFEVFERKTYKGGVFGIGILTTLKGGQDRHFVENPAALTMKQRRFSGKMHDD